VTVESPFAACTADPGSPACTDLFQNLRNPFYIGDSAALTETLGWTDAWTSRASAYAVLAEAAPMSRPRWTSPASTVSAWW